MVKLEKDEKEAEAFINTSGRIVFKLKFNDDAMRQEVDTLYFLSPEDCARLIIELRTALEDLSDYIKDSLETIDKGGGNLPDYPGDGRTEE